MKQLILCSNGYPGPTEEPFLVTEIPYLKHHFKKIAVHRLEQTISSRENKGITLHYLKREPKRVKSLVWKYKGLLLHAWSCELLKSKRPYYYLKNFKRFLNIWIGWLQEAEAWKASLEDYNPKEVIIYSYWYENQAIPLTILRATGKLPFTWVSRAHGWDVDERQRLDQIIPFRHWMLKNKPNSLVSISEFGKQIFKARYKVQVEVQHLGTHDYGLSQEIDKGSTLQICSISSLIPLKRVQLIIEVLAKTKADIEWTHYGAGPLNDEIEWSSLPSNVKLNKRGHLNHVELMQELRRNGFDLMIHLSELEGIPVSIMECMSLGIPVMACDVGGVSEIVTDKNGWLLPENVNTETTAALLDDLAVNQQILAEKGKYARVKWENDYNADVNFPKFIQRFLSKR